MSKKFLQIRTVYDFEANIQELMKRDIKGRLAYGLFIQNKKRLVKVLKENSKELLTINNIKVEGLKEYDEERLAICKEFSKKDEKGEPVLVTDEQTKRQSYDIEKKEEFETKMNELDKKYEKKWNMQKINLKCLSPQRKFKFVFDVFTFKAE